MLYYYQKGVGFMNCNIVLLIAKNKAKLEKLIKSNAPYEEILKQSQKLDKYLIIQIQAMSEYGSRFA